MKTVKWLSGNRAYNAVFLGVAVILFLWTLRDAFNDVRLSEWGCFTDLLYNYGGGFIRRGLTGEIIFFITDVTGIPPLIVTYVIAIIAYLFVGWFIITKFRNHGYSLNVLIMGFMLGSVFITSINDMRRDYIEMAIFICIVAPFSSLSIGKWIVWGNVCAVVAILLHEATFFFMVPICVLVTNIRFNNIIKSICSWIPAIVAFIMCCHYKGDSEMLMAMCGPIREYAPETFTGRDVPYLLEFLKMDNQTVFSLHILRNFTEPFSRHFPIPAVCITLGYILYIPYITICMIKVFSRNSLSDSRQQSLLSLIIFQFVMLIPMFTILSCDFLRVTMYWMMSSVLVWLVLADEDIDAMFCSRYNAISGKITVWCFNRYLPSRLVLTLCMLFIGICYYHRTATELIHNSPAVRLISIIRKVLGFIAR